MKGFFSIVGAQRSGTTWLYHALQSHPMIQMNEPVTPEPKFFLNDVLDDLNQEEITQQRQSYITKYFKSANLESQLMGDKSTSYLEYGVVARRIKRMFPDSKILVVLRNPVDRAISNFKLSKKFGLEKRSIEEILSREPKKILLANTSVSPYEYLERGQYWSYIKPYLDTFGDSVKVAIFEKLIENPEQELSNIFDFLNIEKFDVAGWPQQKVNQSIGDSTISKSLRERLKAYFVPYNEQLSRELNLDLNQWK